MTELANSSRRIEKATYVSIKLADRRPQQGGALLKFGFVRQLVLQPGEVDAVRQASTAASNRTRSSGSRLPATPALWDTLKAFEGSRLPSEMPSPPALANISADHLVAFGHALTNLRQRQQITASGARPGARGVTPTDSLDTPELATAKNLFNAAAVATKSFEANISATPIGMLNLERLEMRPTGIERGALLATIPLAPAEKTAVVHKEWSVTSKEFTSIVTDSLENYSETGVTEKTELSQSTSSQTQHGNQFNVNGTVSGSYPMVTTSVSSGFTAQDQNSQSATDSRTHAITVTRKASSRVKQEHKVTISSTTTTGTSETSTRVLENPSTTNPMRIDYFSLMRKWHVGLYRYGLRLTYDIAIPEPGATMRKQIAELAALREQAAQGFTFPEKPSDVTTATLPGEGKAHYLVLADRYKVNVPHYPEPVAPLQPNKTFNPDEGWYFTDLSFDVPDGSVIDSVLVDTQIADVAKKNIDFGIMGSSFSRNGVVGPLLLRAEPVHDATGQNFLAGARGHQTVTFFMHYASHTDPSWVGLTVRLAPSADKVDQWQNDVWNALFNAAQTAFYAQQQLLTARIQAIEDQITNVDTLTLRREENEEIMKGVLRWLLGPTFDFMPPDVITLFLSQVPVRIPLPGGGHVDLGQAGTDLAHGIAFTGNDLGLSGGGWSTMLQYEEMVKFINEAIEWENVLYFLYPYFWDVPLSWDFIRQIRHPDAIRQAFLRAGSARVVLTVRKGWESDWIRFVETGGFGQALVPGHPYLSIATEILNYDRTNYPGIPPANPDDATPPDAEAYVVSVSTATVAASPSPVTIGVASSDGFRVGYAAVIDAYDSKVQEVQTITAVPDGTHITIGSLTYAHDGSGVPFPVRQAGEKGQLIAEWFEYTPTSGTDIAVTSDLSADA